MNDVTKRCHRLRSLSVVGGFLDELHIDFADGLNCLIGHRGTGKTTVLEFIRYALDEFPSDEAGQACRKRVEALVRSNLGDGRIRLALETRDGLEYIVDRTASGDPMVLTADEEPTDVRISGAGTFSADIFSQNDVENIADSAIHRVKQRRQIILITHNPNIPVLGEAARVYVLTSDGERSCVGNHGSVDDCKTEIINLLEGGKEAFVRRKERYSY